MPEPPDNSHNLTQPDDNPRSPRGGPGSETRPATSPLEAHDGTTGQAPPRNDWQIGDTIPDPNTGKGRWEIHDIKYGGMAVVYVAYDHDLREAVAIKTFRDDIFSANSRVADLFVQEALAWVNLDVHENVVQAKMVERILGKPYLFLEFVSGGDLGGWIGKVRLKQKFV